MKEVELPRVNLTGDFFIESEYLLGIASFWSSELQAARALFEGVVRRFRPELRSEHQLRFGQDAQLVCLSRLANTLWFLGEEAEAAVRVCPKHALKIAREN